jgi:flavin-dependent dehydrogenase
MMGDAAGMITPLCGNGMSMALHACKLAFECIDEFLKQNISRQQMERQYAKKWKHQFAKRLFTGRMVQQFFGNIITTGMFLKSMKALPWLAQKLIQASHGKPF